MQEILSSEDQKSTEPFKIKEITKQDILDNLKSSENEDETDYILWLA